MNFLYGMFTYPNLIPFINVPLFLLSMRQDVFDSIVTFFEKNRSTLDAETKRWAERLIKLGRKNGKY